MFFRKNNVTSKVIPSLPLGIQVEDLDENGRLIPTKFIPELEKLIVAAELKGTIVESDNALISKKSLSADLKYSIVKLNDASKPNPDYFAVYKGKTAALGKGAFGKVVIAQNIQTGKWYALKKQVLRADKKESATKLAQAENIHLINLNLSPKIPVNVRLSPSKQVEQYIILMNLEEGQTVEELTSKQKNIPDIVRLQIAIELLKAGQNLINNKGLLHRDLKEANCIAKLSTMHAALIDYGLSVKTDYNGEYHAENTAGSLETMAVELRTELVKQQTAISEGKDYNASFVFNEKTEIYSYGIIIANLFNLWDNSEAPKELADWKDKNFIVNEEDPLFIDNTLLLNDNNKKFLKDILATVNNMTNYDPQDATQEKRLSFIDSINALEKIKQEYILAYGENAKLKIGVLDINEYYEHYDAKDGLRRNPNIDIRKMGDIFEGMDELILIDTSGKAKDVVSYLKMKNDLIDSKYGDMIIHDTVIIGRDKQEIQKEMTKYLQPLEKKLSAPGSPKIKSSLIEAQIITCPLKLGLSLGN